MSISIESTGLESLRDHLRGAAHVIEARITHFVDGGLAQAKREMVDATPVGKTGALRDDWHIRAMGPFARALTNEAPYAASVMYGARPHAIPGAFGYPLPFGTSPTFHPGNKRSEAMISAMEASSLRIRDDWGKEGQRIAFALVHGQDTP